MVSVPTRHSVLVPCTKGGEKIVSIAAKHCRLAQIKSVKFRRRGENQ